MANPLFNQFGNTAPQNPMGQFMSAFNQLQQTVKNPRAEVEKLLNSGQMSQQQFNQFSQIANQMIGKR